MKILNKFFLSISVSANLNESESFIDMHKTDMVFVACNACIFFYSVHQNSYLNTFFLY